MILLENAVIEVRVGKAEVELEAEWALRAFTRWRPAISG